MLLPPIAVQRIFVTALFLAAIALLVYLVGPHIRATLSRNAVVREMKVEPAGLLPGAVVSFVPSAAAAAPA